MKKIALVVAITLTFTACSMNSVYKNQVVEYMFDGVGSSDNMLEFVDLVIRFEVLDDLTKENSHIAYFSDGSGVIEDFSSSRKINVLSSSQEAVRKGVATIHISEAKDEKYHYKLEGCKSLEKGQLYYGFFTYSEQLNGYIAIAYESAILYDDFSRNLPQDHQAEFYAMIRLYPELFSRSGGKLAQEIQSINRFIDLDVTYKTIDIDGKHLEFTFSYEEESNTETIFYKSGIFQVNGRFMDD